MWHRLRFRLRTLVRPAATLRDIDEELQFHLRQEVERNLARGATPDEARQAAERAFGNVAVHREDARDATGGRGSDQVFAGAEVAVEEPGRFLLVAGHEVAVAVERDLDRGVAEVGAEGLGVAQRKMSGVLGDAARDRYEPPRTVWTVARMWRDPSTYGS